MARIVLLITAAILVVEFAIMTFVLPALPAMGHTIEATIDILLLSGIASPLIYVFLIKPIQHRLAQEHAAKIQLDMVKEQLQSTINDLQAKSQETAALSEMDDLLQTSRTFEEAYRIIKWSGERMFPGLSGGVMVLSNSRNISELAVSWGDAHPVCAPERCNPEDCWALRMGHMHQAGGEGGTIPCTCATDPTPASHVCVPLVAQGQALGVAYLTAGDRPLDAGATAKLLSTTRHIALALANLRLNETLHRQSISDPLTGLFNRRFLQVTLDREVYRAVRRGMPVSVLMLDIDHFKRFNDDFGHEVGDLVIREIGALMKRCARSEDIVCRYGGEEFIVVMPEAGIEVAHARAEYIRMQAEQLKLVHQGQALRVVTLSGGVASFPAHGKLIDDVLKAADLALYESKAGGRNRVTFASLPVSDQSEPLPTPADGPSVATFGA